MSLRLILNSSCSLDPRPTTRHPNARVSAPRLWLSRGTGGWRRGLVYCGRFPVCRLSGLTATCWVFHGPHVRTASAEYERRGDKASVPPLIEPFRS